MNWKRSGFEFLSIFIAVVSAFALNNWNENRRANESESKILTEIANGLEKDIEDIRTNMKGHEKGIIASSYFRDILANRDVNSDSIMWHYHYLTRDFISIQNIAGYQTLKSRGLELIKDDSLRLKIISLYEYEYNTLRKLEEEYHEMQFFENYFHFINKSLAVNFKFNEDQNIIGINLPLTIDPNDRKIILLYLWKIQVNRIFILECYSEIEKKINEVRGLIDPSKKHFKHTETDTLQPLDTSKVNK